jgi:hypothetical protein
MAPPSRNELAWRARVEFALHLAAPALDLLLAAGDRLSRIVDRSEDDPAVPAVPLTTASAPRAVGPGRSA